MDSLNTKQEERDNEQLQKYSTHANVLIKHRNYSSIRKGLDQVMNVTAIQLAKGAIDRSSTCHPTPSSSDHKGKKAKHLGLLLAIPQPFACCSRAVKFLFCIRQFLRLGGYTVVLRPALFDGMIVPFVTSMLKAICFGASLRVAVLPSRASYELRCERDFLDCKQRDSVDVPSSHLEGGRLRSQSFEVRLKIEYRWTEAPIGRGASWFRLRVSSPHRSRFTSDEDFSSIGKIAGAFEQLTGQPTRHDTPLLWIDIPRAKSCMAEREPPKVSPWK